MKADFLLDKKHQYTPQDAYLIGNIFSYNYMEKSKNFNGHNASFITIKNKPQKTNSTGFEFDLDSFIEYRDKLYVFFKLDTKYNEIIFKILWDEDNENDGIFTKSRGRRALYANFEFDIEIQYNDFLSIALEKINSLELFIWFFRGIFDTRGSLDKTTKKIAVDMDREFQHIQAEVISDLSKKYFKKLSEFVNYNTRYSQPSKTSKSKASQMRPNIFRYFEKIGTLNTQLINFYNYFYKDEKYDVVETRDLSIFIYLKEEYQYKKMIDRSCDLNIDSIKYKGNKKNKLSKEAISLRRYLTLKEKTTIWENDYNESSLDDNDIDFVLVEWHHAIPNQMKRNIDFNKYSQFIDSHINFIPLSPGGHALLHKNDNELSVELIERKNKILNDVYLRIKDYIDITENTFREIYS